MNQTDTQQPVDAHALRWAMGKLAAAFPASFSDSKAIEDKAVLWRELLDANPWITTGVFAAGVYQIAWRHKGGFLPEPATALEFFAAARVEVEREAAKVAAAALPPPKPAHVPIHSVAQLIAEAYARYPDLLREAAARQRAARVAALAERGEGDDRGRVLRVQWQKHGRPDGVSEVELPAERFVHDTEARRKERAGLLKGAAAPDWYECLCGTSVIRYPDGRLVEAADQAPHSCLAAKRGEKR